MPEFDATDYFAKKRQEILSQEKLNPVQDQVIGIQRSAEQSAKQAGIDAAVARKREELNKTSLVKTLGLDEDSNVGMAVNAAAHVLAGASRNVVAPLLALPSDLGAQGQMQGADEEDLAAYARLRQGKHTLEDSARLEQQVFEYDPELRRKVPAGTKLDRLLKADSYRDTAKGIRDIFNIDYLKHTGATDALQESLVSGFQKPWEQTKQGWEAGDKGDMVAGVAKLIYNAGDAAIKNPVGAGNYIAENLPQLAAGAGGKAGQVVLGLTNVGYAFDEYNKGIEKYRSENNGAFPPEAKRQEMAMYAASLALAEQLGEGVTLAKLGAGKAAAKVVGKAGAEATKEVAKNAARDGFLKSLGRAGADAAESSAVESATEGYQTFAEGEISGTPAKPEDIYAAAAIGGLTGGVITSAGQATNVLASGAADARDGLATIKGQPTAAEAQEVQEAAIATGDVSALVDPKVKTYDPVRAIAALAGNNELETATPETRQANLEKAGQIVEQLEQQRSSLQSMTSEGVAENQKQLAEAEASGDTELAGLLRSVVEDGQKLDKKALDRNKSELVKLDKRLELARDELTKFSVDESTKVDPTTAEPAAVINLSMAAPERLDLAKASELIKDPSLGAEQRSYLQSFVAARQAEQEVKDIVGVNRQVLNGGNGNLGLLQHRARVSAAILSGNKALATKQLETLRKFEAGHVAKVAAINADPSRHTPRFVSVVRAELKAITAVRTELEAAQAIKFSSQPSAQLQGAADVSLVPQALNSSEDLGAGSQVQTLAGTAEAASAGTEGVREGVDPGDVAAQRQILTARLEYLTNPPADYSSNVAKKIGSWAKEEEQRLRKLGASMDQTSEEFDKVDDLRFLASQLVKKAEQVLEGDQSLTEFEGTQSTEQTAAELQSKTVESTGSTEDQNPQQSSEKTSSDQPVEVHTLPALERKSAPEATYQQQELLGDHFEQSPAKESDATKRPLTSVKNFLSENWDRAMDFVQLDTITEKQQEMLDTFLGKAKEWSATIQANLVRRKRDFWFEDLVQFMVNEGGESLDLDENTKTAMVYAAFSWIAEQQGRDPYNTDEEINAILGRDEDHEVSDREKDALKLAGTRQNVVANALGQRALQALGLRAKPSAPLDLQPKLESQLGTHILKMLMDKGLLERSTLTGKQMSELRGEASASEDKDTANTKHYFIKISNGAVTEDIYQAVRGTQGLLDKLFGVEPGLKEPTREAPKFNQKNTRNTKQSVPKKQAEIMEKENAAEWRVRQDMYSLVSGLEEDVALQIAGADLSEEGRIHKANRSSTQAKNDGLKRELQRAKEFFSGLFEEDNSLAMPIFFDHTVWKQQRVGISTNVVNPQTSKIHRHMLYRNAWETEVKFSDMDNFKLRVAEGLGVKTDKQGNEASLEAFDKKVADPKIKDAVKVLVKQLTSLELTKEEQQVLLAGVKAGGENMHSLDALVALAHMTLAQEAGKDSFTVQMMGEVDGVTNGPMLSHLLMGAAESVEDLFGLLNRGGFFQQGNEHSQYNLWRGASGHFDLYEKTAGNMVKTMRTLMEQGSKKLKAPTVKQAAVAIYAFTGELADKDDVVKKAGRNIIKTPLTAMVFGSSVTAAVESMANKFVESIYAAIEDTANGAQGAMTVDELTDHINTLIDIGGGKRIPTNLTIENMMESLLDGAELIGVKNAFKLTLGEAVATTMKQDFEVFINKRKQFNEAAEATFQLYNAVATAMREKMVDETVAKKDGKPLHDLTAAQEAELNKKLKEIFPVMHTAFSKESGSLRSGLVIAKTARKLSSQPAYSGNVKFSTPFPDGAKSATTRGYEIEQQAPGVAMAPMSVHSLDSYISHIAAALGEVLNVHDAHGAGLANFEETARNLNQATWQAMLTYSPASEMQAALSRTVQGVAKLLDSGDLPPDVQSNLRGVLGQSGIRVMMIETKELAASADKVKLQALTQMQAIDQYALEGGNYLVTDADRAAAEAKLAEVSADLSQAELAAIDVIEKVLEGVEQTAPKAPKVELTIEQDAKVEKSVFGPVGKSTVQSEPDLVKFFGENPKATGQAVVRQLASILQNRTGRSSELNLQLLRLVAKVLPKNVTVQLVTPDMDAENVLEVPKQPSVGWFVAKDGQAVVHLLSDDFQNSGLTVETVLHELIHAALAQVVAGELKNEASNPKYRSEALELIQELEELRELAKSYAKQHGITQFAEALGDIQEFITYGLTNRAFQHQVLSNVSMKSRTQGSNLINGMKAFIERVVGILFRGSSKDAQAQAVNGLTVLTSNVSGLFFHAAQVKQQSADLNLSQVIVRDYSTVDIHNGLDAGATTSEHSEKLRGLLVGIVQKLHGPFGALKASLVQQQALTPQDVWLKALSTGEAPFASSVLKAPMVVSDQEAHALEQVEAVVRAALDHKESSTTSAYKELAKVFVEARAALKPSDFKDANAYDFIFKIEGGADGRSNYLARFAAFALAHQEFSGLLGKVSLQPAPKGAGKTFGERIQKIFEQILAFFHEKATNTFKGQATDVRVEKLVGQLVDIEAKRRVVLARPVAAATLLEAKASELATKAKDKALDVLRSPGLRNHPKAAVRALSKIGGLALEQRLNDFTEAAKNVWNAQVKERHGIVLQMVKEIQGPGKILNLLAVASTNAQRVRKEIISSTTKHVRSAFANGGKDITREQSKGITQVFLRTGVHALLGRFNMTELEQLLTDPKALDKAIVDTEKQLGSFGKYKDQFIHQANALAYFRVTGQAKHPRLMMNAHNIARLYGTGVKSTLSEAEAKAAEEHIAQLVALYALGYSSKTVLTLAKDVLHTENQRSDGLGNGVDYTLKFQKWLEDESRKRVFAGQEALMMHGYTPEITNPNIQVVVATKEEGEELEKHGYVLVGETAKDRADPDQEAKFLYSVQDGGLMAYRSGTTSLTSKRTKGSPIHSGYLNVNTADGLQNASDNADIQHKKPAGLARGPRPDLASSGAVQMVPVVNPHGDIVNWRYMMADETRDNTLQRDNSFDKILGVLHGSTIDKESTTELNTKTFEALKAIYKVQYHKTPESFVLIGPNVMKKEEKNGKLIDVPDTELREIWAMLPEETRDVARGLWNRDGMYVRKDQLTHVFGYRKFSLADALRKDPSQRGTLEKVYATAIENIFAAYKQLSSPGTSRQDAEEYAKRAAVYVARGEQMWQDIVKEIKDIIMVKSITVSLNNISSNMSLLLAQGVPLKDVLRGHLVALRGARAHQQDNDELKRLQGIIDTGTAGVRLASIQTEIARLKDSIARNPVKEMIDAGLMPTIVEDIAEEDDIYSYKSALIRKTEKYTSKLPQGVQDVARQVYMARDTKIYQGLSRLAQVSDFAGRYVLYQHMVNRKQNPLSKEDAVHQASEAFINYDIPMPKFLQYADDMGLTMFTKYVMRIQRVLVRIAEENPARVLMLLTLDQFANLGPIVLDSSWVHRLGNNPLSWGALQAPGALDELATVHAAMALVK